MIRIRYTSGYKYQLNRTYVGKVDIFPKEQIDTNYINLSFNGLLIIDKGYAWDGPSGPTIDTKNFMRGSLVHDALYQLLRMKLLPQDNRQVADNELHRICLEDGMSRLRAWYVHRGVRLGAGFAASPENRRKVTVAP
jgi:hypothetical protein